MSNQKQRIQVPDSLRDVLLEFSIAYLMEQPSDVVDFAVDFFTKLQENRKCSIIAPQELQSPDDDSIISNDEDGVNIFHRSPTYAQDTTPSIDAVQEFINANHNSIANNIALIQTTSPFLKQKYILEAMKQLETRECVFSVTRNYKLRWTVTNGMAIPLNFDPSKRPRRQDWEGELIENGMFYFATLNLLQKRLFQSGSCNIVETEPIDSMEIDTMSDLMIANTLLNHGLI